MGRAPTRHPRDGRSRMGPDGAVRRPVPDRADRVLLAVPATNVPRSRDRNRRNCRRAPLVAVATPPKARRNRTVPVVRATQATPQRAHLGRLPTPSHPRTGRSPPPMERSELPAAPRPRRLVLVVELRVFGVAVIGVRQPGGKTHLVPVLGTPVQEHVRELDLFRPFPAHCAHQVERHLCGVEIPALRTQRPELSLKQLPAEILRRADPV